MSDGLTIQSHRGPYSVAFEQTPKKLAVEAGSHFIVDARVATLHKELLEDVLASPSVIEIEATEDAKSLSRIDGYVERLLAHNVRRSDVLVAVGGGIIQDITCFVASILLRGVSWRFHPTTLLAQADSCIGSKSSINFGTKKNLIGTFFPPTKVNVMSSVLSTLAEVDMRSGVGEMLKIHAIDGPEAFDAIARDYTKLFADDATLQRYIRNSLEIKKRFIEEDEFDRARRNLLNYGHSFGHAIESATDFGVPHGIAVTMGMDLANYVALKTGRLSEQHYLRMHPTLAANCVGFERLEIPFEPFCDALAKDKKNTATKLRLILPNERACVEIVTCVADATFQQHCRAYFAEERCRP